MLTPDESTSQFVTTWSLHDSRKRGHDLVLLGSDPMFKGSWRLWVGVPCPFLGEMRGESDHFGRGQHYYTANWRRRLPKRGTWTLVLVDQL